MTRKPPMTAQEARQIVDRLNADNPSRAARVAMYRLGLSAGNLSDAAREIYRNALDAES
ncbi:MAG: hypothetical protein ACQEUZ_06320 [Pseudomonadota bacterium]